MKSLKKELYKMISKIDKKFHPLKKKLTIEVHFATVYPSFNEDRAEPDEMGIWDDFVKDFELSPKEYADEVDSSHMFYSVGFEYKGYKVSAYSPHIKNPKAIKKKVRCKIIRDNLDQIEEGMGSMLVWAWKKGYIHVDDGMMEPLFQCQSEFSMHCGRTYSWKKSVAERKKILDRRRKACEEVD